MEENKDTSREEAGKNNNYNLTDTPENRVESIN
jgi:hypothetical protein